MVVRMPPQFHHRTTKKEPRCSPRPTAALEERTEEIMDRVWKASDNHVERVAALEEYLKAAKLTLVPPCQISRDLLDYPARSSPREV